MRPENMSPGMSGVKYETRLQIIVPFGRIVSADYCKGSAWSLQAILSESFRFPAFTTCHSEATNQHLPHVTSGYRFSFKSPWFHKGVLASIQMTISAQRVIE